jgi:RNA polymerase sigma factor for flagellar operon FliA
MEAAIRTYQDVRRRTERDALILEHLAFVRHILGRMISRLPAGADRENLESAGICGLVEAAGQFDAARGVSFTTYAYPRIRGAILDELRRNCPLPQHMLERWGRIRDAYAALETEATPEALAERTGLGLTEVEECLRAIQLTRPDSWYEELGDRVADDEERTAPDQRLDVEEQTQALAAAIEELPRQMRLAVTLYYREELRLKEIGEVLGLSESRVSRILSRAQLQLRERLERGGD